MPTEKEHADALGVYLTGTSSEGGAQTDPDACLGNYRSSTEERALGGRISGSIPPAVIANVLGASGEGDGVIRGDASGNLYYTPPGGSEGAAVAIADTETKLLEGALTNGLADEAVRVYRDGTVTLYGTLTLGLVKPWNSTLGMDDLTNAERVAGLHTYRALMLRAHGAYACLGVRAWVLPLGTQVVTDGGQLGAAGAGTITTTGSFADWPATGYAHIKTAVPATREIVYYSSRTATVLTVPAAGRGLLGTGAAAGAATDTADAVSGTRLAPEIVDGDAKIQTIANETTAPAAVVWDSGCTAATGVQIGAIASATNHGLWIHRQTPAGQTLAVEMENAIGLQFWAQP